MRDRSFLGRVQRPTRYAGGEIHAVRKDPRSVAVRFALLFPDLYEVGMSHLGINLLYGILNQQEEIWAERVFAPAPDLEADLRERRLPLTSLESGTPLHKFDLLGVSLQYELGFTNLLNMLDLGGVPLLAAERGPGAPVVIGGGPACFNPEPLAPFFDAMVLGDGEEVILELAATVRAWKQAAGSREELYRALEELEGVYVPAWFEPVFDETGRLREMRAKGRRNRVRKRLVADLNRFPPPPRPLVPYCQIIHDRLTMEVSRGCTRGCRYCQAGMIYRPVREREPEAVLHELEEAVGVTGYEEASLLTLSAGDYAALPWLLESLMNRLAPRRVALSLPSLRADTLTPEMMAQIKRVRRTGLTIAPEAGSQRLRQVINKNLTEEEILAAAQRAFYSGWQLLKLYFMIGLPRETAEDLEAIAALARRILTTAPRGRRARLNVSLAGFIPKSHTPFQWERQEGLEESRGRLQTVKDRLRHPQIQAKWNSAAQSWLEGILARGDRRLAPALLSAYQRGCRLDAWSEHLRLEPWRQAFRETGIDPDFYLRERSREEVLPWDHLDAGVSREFLASERARAYQDLETPDCRQAGCQDCGVCDGTEITLRTQEAPTAPPAAPDPVPLPSQPQWYRLAFAKLEEARWLGHLELVSAIYRSLRRSGLPLVFSEGFHPLPRVSFHGALSVGVESLAETLDVELTHRIPSCSLVETLNRALPPGFRILNAARLPRRLPPPRVESIIYQVESEEPLFNPEAAAAFLAQETFPVIRRRPKEEKTVDLRHQVARLEVVDSFSLQLELRHQEKDNLKVTQALAAIFQLGEDRIRELQILKMQVNCDDSDNSSQRPIAVASCGLQVAGKQEPVTRNS